MITCQRFFDVKIIFFQPQLHRFSSPSDPLPSVDEERWRDAERSGRSAKRRRSRNISTDENRGTSSACTVIDPALPRALRNSRPGALASRRRGGRRGRRLLARGSGGAGSRARGERGEWRWCRESGSNRHGAHAPRDFKSLASTRFAIPARAPSWGRTEEAVKTGEGLRNRRGGRPGTAVRTSAPRPAVGCGGSN